MPTLSLGEISYASDASAVTVENTTVYTSPTRSDYAAYIKFYKVHRTGELTEMEQTSYDPETDDSYTAVLDQDGWVQAWFVNIPDYNNLTAYIQYDAVYYNGAVYRALQSSTGNLPSDTDYWEVIESPTSLIDNDGETNESVNIYFLVYDFVASAYSRVYAGTAASTAAVETKHNAKRSEDVLSYEFFYTMLDGLVAAGDRQRYAEAERIARKIQDEYAKISAE